MHEFKVGDRIRVLDDIEYIHIEWRKGEIMHVVGIDQDGDPEIGREPDGEAIDYWFGSSLLDASLFEVIA